MDLRRPEMRVRIARRIVQDGGEGFEGLGNHALF
jgi:hypothetical protein